MSAPSSVTPLSSRNANRARATSVSASTSPTPKDAARARWRMIRAVVTVLRSLRDRKHREGGAVRTTSSFNATRPQHVSQAKGRSLPAGSQQSQHSQQAGHGAKGNDVRSAAMQMEAWFAKKRDLFQRVVSKPIQNRSDVDIKLLTDYICQSRFLTGLSSASADELARALHFQTFHDGEVLFHQGNAIVDVSARYLVVQGSLFVYKSVEYAKHARNGEEYTQWFMASNPENSSDAVKYGDCAGACGVGDTCGDASFRRVSRYNVNCDASLLNAVGAAFQPTKATRVNARSTFVATCKLGEDIFGDRARVHLLQRFFGQFSCFRLFPPSIRIELMRKVELRVFRNDEVLCHAGDSSPKMFMVLSGKVCVHYSDSHEEMQLRGYDGMNFAFSPPTAKRKANVCSRILADECEVPTEVVTRTPNCASRHICTLVGGGTFGDVGMRERQLLQNATLFNPITTGALCSVLTLSYDDYNATLTRYLEATEFTAESVYAILSDTLPRDRSCEQVGYVWAYLMRKCQAQVFFNQLPLHTLSKICLHAGIEKYHVGDDAIDFIQKEDEDVSCMRVVLNGYVCAFKNKSRWSGQQPNANTTLGSATETVAPKPAVLRRFQSRLICGNTKILERPSGARQGQPGVEHDDMQTVDPVSILPHGAAFGQHQIFTGSKSPFSFAAYSAGPTPTDAVPASRQSDAWKPNSTVHVFIIPARIVKTCFPAIDEYIVYNSVRIFKRIASVTEMSAKVPGAISNALYGLGFDRLLFLNPCFSGIPRTRLSAAVASIDVVHVPTRRIIYDTGESTKGANFLVLSGHVRIFKVYASKNRQLQQNPSNASTEEKRLPKLLRKVSQNLQATQAALEKQLSSSMTKCPFDRYAEDHIFLRNYDRTTEIKVGDCFGRQIGGEDASDESTAGKQGSSLARRVSTMHAQQQQQTPSSGGECAITMSECLIASLSLKRLSTETSMLNPKEKREIIGLIQMREELEGTSEAVASSADFNQLATSFKVLERMRVGDRLTTAQRVGVATSLRYCRIKSGDIVYKQGEESLALYFVLTGNIRLYSRAKDPHALIQQRSSFSAPSSDEWLVDLFEGDVFGEEAIFDGCIGSKRLTTAVAASSSDSEDIELLYLTRQQHGEVGAPHLQVGRQEKHRSGITNFDEYSQQLLGLGKQAISSRERWRFAINQIIQGRAKRSRWHSVLLEAKRHRVELMFDLLHTLPVLSEAPKTQVFALCTAATLQTYPQDSVVFAKGDNVEDQCFLVLTGTVVLQQFCSGTTGSSMTVGVLPLALSPSIQDSATQKITVQTMKAGDVFGDFELFADKNERQIYASTCSAVTKLIIMPREDFLAYWPRHARLESKLLTIERAFYGVYNLDSDHLCSLYYAMQERAFTRNEVMSGWSSQSGFLHIIESGLSIVHERVTLQKRADKRPELNKSPTRLAVDTRVASLGPGALLFTDKQEDSVVDNSTRRASPKPQATSVISIVDECANEYVTADSPIVHTFSLQLFPRSKHLNQASRSPELFVMVVLGKHGLQAIKTHISEHQSWRTNNTACASRVVEASLPREVVSPQNNSKAKIRLQQAPGTISGSHPLDLAYFLKDRQLVSSEDQPSSLGKSAHSDKMIMLQLDPRAFNQSSAPKSPRAVHRPLGSFSNPPSESSKTFSFPALSFSSKKSDPSCLPQLPSSPPPPSKGPTAPTPCPSLKEQLRKEEHVLEALSSPTKASIGNKNTMTLEKQQRRRHGHPPPKIIENRGKFVDEHTLSPIVSLQQEHDRKKSGLCRRLLHLK